MPHVHSKDFLNAEFEESVLMVMRANGFVKDFPDPPKKVIAAAYGATDPNGILVSEATARYVDENPKKFLKLKAHDRERKIRRWELSMLDFIAFGGDIDIRKITKTHAKDFMNWLVRKADDEEITEETARMKLSQVSMIVVDLLDKVFDIEENPFAKTRIEVSPKTEKAIKPFTHEHMLVVNELQPRFPAVRALMDIAECTGAGMRELVGLAPEDIVLDAEIPHLKLRPNRFRKYLKNDNRPRDLPLLGKALIAARKYPEGFPEYRHDKGDEEARGEVNRMLKAVKIPRSWNSFRHRFKDMVENSGSDDMIRANLMGWAKGMDAKYGDGLGLQLKQEAIEKAMRHSEECQSKALKSIKDKGETIQIEYTPQKIRHKKRKLTPRESNQHTNV